MYATGRGREKGNIVPGRGEVTDWRMGMLETGDWRLENG